MVWNQTWKQSKQLLKWTAPLSLALVLAACGGNDNKDKSDPSPSASSSATVSASPTVSPSPSLSASASASPSASKEATAGMKKFESEEYKMSLEYPEKWTMRDDIPNVIAAFLSPQESADDTFQENITIVAEDLKGQDISLDKYIEISKTNIKKLVTDAKFEGEPVTDKLTSGQTATAIKYTGKQGELKLSWTQIVAINDGKAYVLTATTPQGKEDTFSNEFGAIADSWEIK